MGWTLSWEWSIASGKCLLLITGAVTSCCLQFFKHFFFFEYVWYTYIYICGKASILWPPLNMVLDARAGPHAASINWLPCKPLKCLLLESVQPQNRVATGISLLYLLVEWQVVHLCRNSSAVIGGGHGLLKGCQIACSSHTYAFMCPCSVFLLPLDS